MKKTILVAAFAAAALLPATGMAAIVDATLIPDGTYLVKVEKIVDASHITVMMHSGLESTLASTGSANFASVKTDTVPKVSIIRGRVPVFALQ
ncbi:MAG: hypothetical protein M3R30_02350 [Candidatus Eremiobacteraeota bacterium]|nr:hypothetical protein [Candidatus Eremiobacteraeota bacterium]